MAGEIGGTGGGSCGGDSDAPSSPRNRVKFLCSHGGRILPRPADGHLKYVGGDTRVVALSRSITFAGAHFVSLFLLNFRVYQTFVNEIGIRNLLCFNKFTNFLRTLHYLRDRVDEKAEYIV